MKILFLVLFVSFQSNLFAFSGKPKVEHRLDVKEIENDTLDIDGEYDAPAPKGAARMRKQREMMEQKTQDMVARNIERIRLKNELELEKALRQQMEHNLKMLNKL